MGYVIITTKKKREKLKKKNTVTSPLASKIYQLPDLRPTVQATAQTAPFILTCLDHSCT